MKLSGLNRIRKVRKTIYQDPGNPFTDDNENVSVFTMPFRQASGHSLHTICHAAHKASSRNTDTESIDTSWTRDSSESRRLLNGTPFEDAIESPQKRSVPWTAVVAPVPLRVPIPQRRGIPFVIRSARNSVTATLLSDETAVPPLTAQLVAPRTLRSVSNGQQLAADTEDLLSKDSRNTVFYGFYNPLLEEYDR